jgi:tRNA nucleotidyltransferase (CCA-adding enzyme)
MINLSIVKELEKVVSPLFLVGGCVRDTILEQTPKDIDLTTPVFPDEVQKKFKKAGYKLYEVGIRFGTVGIKVEDKIIEITTFRKEKYEKDNRKPEVNFVKDLESDLSRRDFTINAIAMDSSGKIIDPFAGQTDLIAKIIRCVGMPKARFKEDALRMLRAGRFASQLGFTVEQSVEDTAKQLAYKILTISKERWVIELDKLLMTDKPEIGLDFFAKTRLLNYILPEIALQVGYNQNSPYHSLELWEHTLGVVKDSPKDLNIRWSALLHDIGKPFVRKDKKDGSVSNYVTHDFIGGEFVEKIASYLKWSSDRKDIVKNLVLNHLEEDSPLKEADERSK